MLMAQIDVSLKYDQYRQDVSQDAGAAKLADDLGRFRAAVLDYERKVGAAGTQGLINPSDFANRVQLMGDLTARMEVIRAFANVRDQATAPFTPGPFGGLAWSGGPIALLWAPFLPSGTMTQIGPSVVALGTGGQGAFSLQVGGPQDLGYPIVTNVAPVQPTSAPALASVDNQVLVINPATTGATVSFLIDQTPHSLAAGQELPLTGRSSWPIVFDRGAPYAPARYTLTAGSYTFIATTTGWDLRSKTYKVTLDNSANAEAFNYLLDGQSGTVPAREKRELQSKRPIVLTFDRGDGKEAVHRDLVEGTFTIGIDPRTGVLDLFPGAAPTPSSTASSVTSTAPAPPAPADLP